LCAQIIAPTLVNLYNMCIESGKYPEILKIAKVMPPYKNGPKDECSNYRLISLLSPFSKLFEKYLHERLVNYFEKFNILTPNQFGFRNNSFTSHAVRQLYDELFENIDEKKYTSPYFST